MPLTTCDGTKNCSVKANCEIEILSKSEPKASGNDWLTPKDYAGAPKGYAGAPKG